MSLINDALKRARLEAARREAEDLPGGFAAAPSHAPRRPRTALYAGLVAVLLATALAAFWLLQRGETPAAPTTVAESRPSEVAPTPEDAGVQATAPPTPERVETSAPAASTPRGDAAPEPEEASSAPIEPPAQDVSPTPEEPAAAAVTPRSEPASHPAPTPPAAEQQTSPAPDPAPASSAAQDETRTFVKIARLSGGRQLHLQGIAWSDTQPVAVINGRALGIGEGLEGYLVEAIDRDFVTLRGGDTTLTIRLR